LEPRYGHTACPRCGKPVIVIDDGEDWQYICGWPWRGKLCGTAFKFKEAEDDDEADG
jgi:hypothetical protein